MGEREPALKRCPHCGEEPRGVEFHPTNPPKDFHVWHDCPARRCYKTKEEAVAAWNTHVVSADTDRQSNRALEHRICKQYQERFREWFRCALAGTLMDPQARIFLESFIKDLPVEYVDDADAAAEAKANGEIVRQPTKAELEEVAKAMGHVDSNDAWWQYEDRVNAAYPVIRRQLRANGLTGRESEMEILPEEEIPGMRDVYREQRDRLVDENDQLLGLLRKLIEVADWERKVSPHRHPSPDWDAVLESARATLVT